MAQNSCKEQNSFPLSGEIRQMTVPWFFQALRIQSKTGTALFEYVQTQTALPIVKKVFFKNGDIIFAASTLPADHLSDRLLSGGKLTRAQYDALSELIEKTGKKQGALLVQMGFLSPQDLVAGVKDQVKAIVLSLFDLRLGTYRFDEGPLPADEIIPLQMSTGNLTLEGVNALDWQIVRKSLPSPDTVIRPATDPSCLFQDAQLTGDQRTVFGLVDGKRSIEEVCSLSGVGDFNALKAVYLLLALRMAEIGAIKSEKEMEDARSAVQAAVRSEEAQRGRARAEPEIVVTRESIQEAHTALARQNHYEVLNVAVTATAADIKHAYFRLAKAYHPDRHFDAAMADLKSMLEALFTRIHEAYDTLSNPSKREAYDRSNTRSTAPAAAQRPSGGDFVEKRAEEYQENYAEKVARAAEQFSEGLKEFKIGNYWGAEEKFAWASRMDPIKAPYFFYHGICLANIPRRKHEAEEVLQKAIELDATKVEYHIELSNLYLKSGLKTRALSVLNAALEQVSWVDKVQEAIVLAGEGKLAPVIYDAGTKDAKAKGPGGPSRQGTPAVSKEKAAQALEQFNKGLKDFRTNNFGLAVDPFAAAVRLDPAQAQYHFYYGVTLSRIARRREEAEEPLKKALELDQTRIEHHLELGSFYLKSGLKAKALGVLNNALLHHPNAPRIQEAIKAAVGAAK
ncbi:MAG: DnaJ domain-containing protein [Nitrospirota bacterium]|nr:DnaJ domain-containing protein [Nitrospirota bacterium]